MAAQGGVPMAAWGDTAREGPVVGGEGGTSISKSLNY